ncbi:unnamed protein product [Cylindrotheca closterium]|uniref:beta-glucosidase n=1 Tax=Cylindrotheca closterium TaxID=2856 RepID=A0AAD2JNH8_9STRA|nr:unnamed protein product [Cylindrotheca closterium]
MALNESHKRQEQCSQIIAKLTLEEKLSLLTGDDIWTVSANFPRLIVSSQIRLSDGPHGIRKPINDLTLQEAFPATCFPPACALACSWSPDVLYQIGEALSRECDYFGDIKVLLGPAMNLKRHPGGGRNLEYFSEDPNLTGKLAAAYVRGIQASGRIGACPKHFAVNNQESHRMVVDAIVDERTMRELYLLSFEIVVKESAPKFIMGAYNRLNGTYCCNHKNLLQEILRSEWGFDGVCVTDWAATDDRAASIKAGMDLEMPGTSRLHHKMIRVALERNELMIEDIDVCAERILRFLLESTSQPKIAKEEELMDRHNVLAHEIAMECAVLLKNDHQTLPLAKDTKVALIGDFAKDNPRYQGMGSSHVSATKVSCAYDAMAQYTDSIYFARGYDADNDDDTIDQEMIDDAVAVAKRADVVVIFLGLPEIMESEGFDRPHLQLPKECILLFERIQAIHPKVVVVLSNGGTVELPDSFLEAQAILEGYLLGQAGGSAIVDLLFGKSSPCGRLPETMPISAKDIPSDLYFPGTRDRVEYREGLDVGYRYFDTATIPVRFPFGYGLTYTTFEYSSLRVKVLQDDPMCKKVSVAINLSNTGPVSAKEVVQLYIRPSNATVYRPHHELKAFSKILLKPSQNETLTWELTERDFAFYDIGSHEWIVESGSSFEIRLGASSRDIRLKEIVTFSRGRESSRLARDSYPSGKQSMSVDDASFGKRFVISDIFSGKTGNAKSTNLHRNSLLSEVGKASLFGRFFHWMIFSIGCLEIRRGPSYRREVRMVEANVANLPLRTVALFSKGALSFEVLDILIIVFNNQLGTAVYESARLFTRRAFNGVLSILNWVRR